MVANRATGRLSWIAAAVIAVLSLGVGSADAQRPSGGGQRPNAGVQQPDPATRYEQMGDAADLFDEVSRTVQEQFYSTSLNGADWQALRAQYRPQVLAARDLPERRRLINEMLGALKASHTEYFTADQTEYYELADLFSFAFRGRLNSLFPGGRVSYVGIGAYTSEIDGKLFVSGLLDGLPAARAGLKVGDEIVSADGAAYGPIASFVGKDGKEVTIAIRRRAEGPVETVVVKPTEIRPAQSLLDAIDASARILTVGGKRIGYVHLWCAFGDAFERQFEKELATKLADADALVWDLRDGWGGTSNGYLDIFNTREPTLAFIERGGRPSLSQVKWAKPVAMVINHGTRSVKEILAYGFKKYGLGEVVGSGTAQAVLASRAFLMRDGSLLLLAVGDVTVDGERLEGIGVDPTIPVELPLPYRDGADPQLDRALELLGG